MTSVIRPGEMLPPFRFLWWGVVMRDSGVTYRTLVIALPQWEMQIGFYTRQPKRMQRCLGWRADIGLVTFWRDALEQKP